MVRRNVLLFFAALIVGSSNVAWARATSESSVSNPILSLEYPSIDFPAYGKPGVQKDTSLRIENTGDTTLTYTVTKFETTGPAGWLGFAGFPSPVAPGFANSVTGTIRLNVGGALNPVVGKVLLTGGLVLTSNAPSSPDTLPIVFIVADTVVPPSFDTIFARSVGTAKLALGVSSNGNFGNQGQGSVNMDYANYGDCDPTAEVYLYDGSVVVGWVDGDDTVMNWTIYGDSWLNDSTALYPHHGLPDSTKWKPRFRSCGYYEYYRSSRFVTNDTTLALEKFWYAPKLNTVSEDSLFVIQGLRVWNISGAPRTGVTIGDVIDWNIPSDSGAINASGVNLSPAYIWQRGVDFDGMSCQPNANRWAGMKFIGRYTKNNGMIFNDSNAYSAYTAYNDSFVVPNNGFQAGELYRNFAASGFSAVGDSADLHMGMCFRHDFVINPTDTFVFYTVLATVRNGSQANLQSKLTKGKSWFNLRRITSTSRDSCGGGCDCIFRGDVNFNFGVTISDVTYLVSFLFNNGPSPIQYCSADINDSGVVTVADLVYLVQYLFNNGPSPIPCGSSG